MYKQIERIRETKGRVRAFLYARCSSDEQKKNGYTVKDQLEFGRLFCKENDIILVGEYVDEGISATLEIKKRKDLANLINDAESGEADLVVFKCIDRFFRNTEEYYAAQKQLRKSGVTWASIEEPDLDPNDADAAFKINIYLAMAEYEARKTSKRIRFNNKMRIKNKQVVTGSQNFLFPWKVVGDKRNRHLERDMDQAERLYDLLDYFEIHQSKSGTVEYNNSKYDQKISYETLSNLLNDTLLYGEYKGIPDYVAPSITKERFDNIQAILKRTTRIPASPNREFLFSGLIRCYHCGRIMVGNSHAKGNGYVFAYRCNNYRLNRACINNASFGEKKLEKYLLNSLDTLIEAEIAKVEAIKEKKIKTTDNTRNIAEIKKEMARLNTMFRKGRIEEDEYDKDFGVLDKRLKALTVVEEPAERDLTALKEIVESDYRTIYNALDKPHRKAFWRNIIKEFTIGEDRQIIPESSIFF